ncbi:JmjC domain-containing protein [Kitasatospora sp. NPDC058032]|uniref:JmjC domain-containing protein n=1 Tax=Kitasatospora sp. NPDC058032 TaxID=3346307 RepID=UPI0036D942FB
MSTSAVVRLDEADRLTLQPGPVPDGLDAQVRRANATAVHQAAERLRHRLGDGIVSVLASPCSTPVTGTAHDDAVPLPGRAAFEQWLTDEPRLIAGPGTGANADMELRDAHGKLPGARFGHQLEPGSDTFQMDIHRVRHALADGVTLGVRQFDRWSPALAELSDDLVAVSGADVFTKLFISAGTTSVTGWHNDQQDVIALMLWGSKQFQLGDWDTPDGGPPNRIVADSVLGAGDCLLFPERHPHQAVPLGDDSGLLSIALLRHHNWISRNQIPTHLGVNDFPPSEKIYRHLLRSRIRLSPDTAEPTGKALLRTRVPGGAKLLGTTGDGRLLLSAAGSVHAATPEAISVLARVHEAFPCTVDEAVTGVDPATAAEAVLGLVHAGLIIQVSDLL